MSDAPPTTSQPYDVFLSYNSRDHRLVESVAKALRERHGLNPFLDRWYLAPGRPWTEALEEHLGRCRAVAVFVGPSGTGSWQQRERDFALDRQAREDGRAGGGGRFPVIPVLLPGADPGLSFLRLLTWVDLRNGVEDPAQLEVLSLAIRGQPPGPGLNERVAATLAVICPYRGLRPFREEDAPFFLGRDAFVGNLRQAVGQSAMVAVVGASGSGKSSVVYAGLLPLLRKVGQGVTWDVVSLVPGDRPLHSLAAALVPRLEPEMSEVGRLEQVGKLAAHFATGIVALRDVVAQALAKQRGTDRLMLVVDQGEELFTLCRDEAARRRFCDELLDATTNRPLSVVWTLRGDFFGRILEYRPLADRLQGAVVNLGPMTRGELQQAMEGPARKVGLSFEPGLVDRILDDVEQSPGHLPLLEFVLTALWESRRAGVLSHEAYEAMGGVQGAMARRADEAFARLSIAEQESIRRVFLQLVRPGEGTQDTRRRAALPEVPEAARPLVRQMADARLLVTGRDPGSGEETVEVAHEALIQHWGRLRNWVDADREFLLWRQRLRTAIDEWERNNRDDAILLRGPLLTEAERHLGQRASDLSDEERGFISGSSELHARERVERERRQRRTLYAVSAALVVAVLIGAVAAYQWLEADDAKSGLQKKEQDLRTALGSAKDEYQRAEEQRKIADERRVINRSGQLAGQSLKQLDERLDLAMLLALEAYNVRDTFEARNSLLTSLHRSPYLDGFLSGHSGRVCSAAATEDGGMLASGDEYGEIILWNLRTRAPLDRPLRGHNGWVRSLCFTRDGRSLASGSSDGAVILWDVDARSPLATFTGHGLRFDRETVRAGVNAVAFSKDEKLLASGGADGRVFLWDVAKRVQDGVPLGGDGVEPTDDVECLAFSPDGSVLAVGGAGTRALVLWDVASREPKDQLQNVPRQIVRSVAFSPDGNALASAHGDGRILMWAWPSGTAIQPAPVGHSHDAQVVAFSRDGSILASGGDDNLVRLWNVSERKVHGAPLEGHSDSVAAIIFTGEGTLASAGDDSVILWNIEPQQLFASSVVRRASPAGAPIPTFEDNFRDLAIAGDPESGVIAVVNSSSADRGILLWDTFTAPATARFLQTDGTSIAAVALSGDGRLLASASRDGGIQLWDVPSGQPKGRPRRFDSVKSLRTVAVSRNGRFLAAGGEQGIVLLDPSRDVPVKELRGHTKEVTCLAFSRDAAHLVSGSLDTTVTLWNVSEGRRVSGGSRGHTDAVLAVAFSPEGRYLASGGTDQSVRVWDASGPLTTLPLSGHRDLVTALAFSPDGATLVSGSADGSILLWDRSTHERLGQYLLAQPLLGTPRSNHPASVESLGIRADGTALVSSHGSRGIRIWDFGIKAWCTRARRVANRNLTEAEWGRYFPGEAYRRTCPDLPDGPRARSSR